ncbi:DUF503 domain-containing protein [Listeria costaricensis]|uniref:DUF503 domain-containing protein n=1 Tax=Listeria costaricensis TaxID=2026604 RepID=UPI000C073601|nr:DUF503 family protein [Listeria costaricensis]
MILTCVSEFHIFDAGNLKEKRAVTRRILTRTRQKFNISIAETAFHDKWQRTEITFAIVSGDKKHLEKELQAVFTFLDSFPEWERSSATIDFI